MAVVLLYGPGHEEARNPGDWPSRHYDQIPDGADVLVIWRTVREPDSPDGQELYHVYSAGAWENVTAKAAMRALKRLLHL